MRYLLGFAGLAAIAVALVLARKEMREPIPSAAYPSVPIAPGDAPAEPAPAIAEVQPLRVPRADAGVVALAAKAPSASPASAPQGHIARRSPDAWQTVHLLLTAWFSRKVIPRASRILEDACANMGSVGADSIGQTIEGMRDAGVFDPKLYNAAIEERARILADALDELTTLSGGKFANHELDQLSESPEFSRACPTLGMNHDDDDEGAEPTPRQK